MTDIPAILPSSHTRAAVVALARTWIGTPYHHQASRLGVGADCVGFIHGLWRTLYGHDAEIPPGYSRDCEAEPCGSKHSSKQPAATSAKSLPTSARPGDILVFRFKPHLVAKHAALLGTETTIIHALEGAAVAEVAFTPWWRRRIAAAFSFPGIID